MKQQRDSHETGSIVSWPLFMHMGAQRRGAAKAEKFPALLSGHVNYKKSFINSSFLFYGIIRRAVLQLITMFINDEE